jgi:hypothetical protein
VRVRVDGVPRFGVVRVGLLEKTTTPPPDEPVSSDSSAASCDEFENDEDRPREDVATVKTPPLLERPVPVRSVKRSPLITKLVVVAVTNVAREIEDDAVEIIPPVKVSKLDAVSTASLLRNEVEATPPNCLASNADGTVPSDLRGVISESLSTFTPRYNGWLKLTPESELTLPSMTLNRPLVTVTSLPPVRVSVQIATPPLDWV